MKSALPKVLHAVDGKPMIEYALDAARTLHPASTTVVVGHQADALKSALSKTAGLTLVVQEPQLGTAHALLTTEPVLGNKTGVLVLLSGDVPLLTAKTLKTLIDRHASAHAAATVLTAVVDNPFGYGRIVRNGAEIARIVEERDASPAEREIREINSVSTGFSARSAASPPRTRSGSITCPISWRSIAATGARSRRRPWSIPMRSAASTAGPSWPR